MKSANSNGNAQSIKTIQYSAIASAIVNTLYAYDATVYFRGVIIR